MGPGMAMGGKGLDLQIHWTFSPEGVALQRSARSRRRSRSRDCHPPSPWNKARDLRSGLFHMGWFQNTRCCLKKDGKQHCCNRHNLR